MAEPVNELLILPVLVKERTLYAQFTFFEKKKRSRKSDTLGGVVTMFVLVTGFSVTPRTLHFEPANFKF